MTEYLPMALLIIGVCLTCACISTWIYQYPSDICKIKPKPTRKNDLKDYSDDYLYTMMKMNNILDVHELAWFCSEILRRKLDKDHKKDSINEGCSDD